MGMYSNRDYEQEIEDRINSLEKNGRILDEKLNQFCNDVWLLMYPNDPLGWDNVNQIYDRLENYIKELKEKAV